MSKVISDKFITKYHICHNEYLPALAEEVNAKLAEGYQLFGTLQFIEGRNTYIKTMVKYKGVFFAEEVILGASQ